MTRLPHLPGCLAACAAPRLPGCIAACAAPRLPGCIAACPAPCLPRVPRAGLGCGWAAPRPGRPSAVRSKMASSAGRAVL
ncbi:hypothetical protein SFR_3456 [Streptomyces sp. FR-008]|nr:hypothetical protein SFR_3456 [Streptomyces sp. FR-008]